ncbi:MAG: farnesyl diphosphate synthase [Pseudomonadota bacterium]
MTDFNAFTGQYRHRIQNLLQAAVTLSDSKLSQAIAYSVLNGGKRLRPLLIYATAEALSAPPETVDTAACSIELIHCYSLIHDDLPAMDDDDFRRGNPTCHKAFDEASAILAGDALQSLAFEILAKKNAALNPTQQLKMICALSKAIGMNGMAYGQSLDIEANPNISLAQLQTIHTHKTGLLIKACVELALIAANCDDENTYKQLCHYADCIGLLFQIQDDILDVEGEITSLGKLPGVDRALGRATYPEILGMRAAKEKRDALYQQALQALADIHLEKSKLAALAHVFVERKN